MARELRYDSRRKFSNLTLQDLASRSFGRHAAEKCIEMLLLAYIKDDMVPVDEICNELRAMVHRMPKPLADVISKDICIQLRNRKDYIKKFEHFPWVKTVLQKFSEAVIHPGTTTIYYTESNPFILQYVMQHFVKEHEVKKFIVKINEASGKYEWGSTNPTLTDAMLKLENEESTAAFDMSLLRIYLSRLLGEDVYKLEDFLGQLYDLEVLIFPMFCTRSILKCLLCTESLKVLDVSFSRRIDNECVPHLTGMPNLEAISIFETRINQHGTVELLKLLLNTNRDTLKYFLGSRMFNLGAVILINEFPYMKSVERSLQFFGSYQEEPILFRLYDMIKSIRHRREQISRYNKLLN